MLYCLYYEEKKPVCDKHVVLCQVNESRTHKDKNMSVIKKSAKIILKRQYLENISNVRKPRLFKSYNRRNFCNKKEKNILYAI